MVDIHLSNNDGGELEYNGVNVNEISKDADGILFMYTAKVPYSDDIYVDVGLNVSVNAEKRIRKQH